MKNAIHRLQQNLSNMFIGISILIPVLSVPMAVAAQDCPIIPQPQHAVQAETVFLLDNHTAILLENGATPTGAAYYVQQVALRQHGLSLAVSQGAAIGPVIRFRLVETDGLADQGYRLKMDAQSIVLEAANERGLFAAGISLLQLMDEAAQGTTPIQLPCWTIEDAPRFSWRGVMLDESRHFFGKAQVKQLLDWMAYYKLNVFHWHLTDVPGWRGEIKNYPKLTLVGGIGNHTD